MVKSIFEITEAKKGKKKKKKETCVVWVKGKKQRILWNYLWDAQTTPPPFVFWVILLSFNLLNQSFPLASHFAFKHEVALDSLAPEPSSVL